MIVNEHIPDLIVEIDNCNSSEIVELALKVLLLSLDFHINKITQDVTKAINWSKSIGMLPFRVILNKFANNSRISLQPAPVDLYRCIKGD